MDLIHADSDFNELGYVDFIRYDGVISVHPELEKNDWEADILADDFNENKIKIGDYIYFPSTEWGGRVEKIEHISVKKIIKISGTTWRGMLIRRIIIPPPGEGYLDLKGTDINTVIMLLIAISSDELFETENTFSVKTCKRKFRYDTLLEGISDMLNDVGCRLEITLNPETKKVMLTTKDIIDHSEEIEFSGDYDMSFTSTLAEPEYNHVIALGQGELEKRTVKHLWLLPNGQITDNPDSDGISKGLQEKTFIYDFPNCEDADELINEAKKKLLEYAVGNSIDFNFDSTNIDLPLGDKVGMRDRITGMSGIKTISQKILTISSNGMSLQYCVE